ncbi:unnamed protein product, partial [marine sediment metagenome]
KLIQADIDDEDVEWDSPLGRAYKLSFEALKRLVAWRNDNDEDLLWDLPGETTD